MAVGPLLQTFTSTSAITDVTFGPPIFDLCLYLSSTFYNIKETEGRWSM